MEPAKPFSVTESPLVDFEAVCQRIRAAVEPARAHAVSLHNESGDVLWLSESSMGPDEHNAVREALDGFSNMNGPSVLAYDLGDLRSAVLLRAADGRRALVGAVMLILDTRNIQRHGQGASGILTPKLQRAVADFAAMRPPAKQEARAVQPVTQEIDRLHGELRRSPITLHVQRLVPLAKGSLMKRYEVLLRSESEDAPNAAPRAMLKAAVETGLGSMIDRRVVTEIIGWLVRHPDVWQAHGVQFSVNLTSTALHDEHFIKFVGLCLAKSALPRSTIAFEIDVPTAVKLGDKISEIATGLDRLGCPLVLDDFALRTECFNLLRLPGVRYIKLAPEITGSMRTDKLSQAAITAVTRMARVLGMHTVAKHTETAAEQGWLTALGVDFIQSNAFSPSASIETLLQTSQIKP